MTAQEAPGYDIRFARLPEELGTVRRFWYSIYVEEMGRHLDIADHDTRELADEREQTGDILTAWHAGQLCGALVITASRCGSLNGYDNFYEMTRVGPDHPKHTAIVTKLMVAREHRNTSLVTELFCATFRHGQALGVRHAFVDCNTYLIPFFTKFGFQPWCGPVQHPDYGEILIMKVDLRDADYFREIGSPFCNLAQVQSRAAQL